MMPAGPMPQCGMPVRTVIDRGPKGKRVVAFSLDWPGWSRGAKTPVLALETFHTLDHAWEMEDKVLSAETGI